MGGASLRRNFAWMLTGNVVYATTQWGILVVLAKLGNVEMVGQYGYGVAITGPVFMLANMYLANVLATDPRGEIDFADYSGTRLITTLSAIFISLAAAFVSHLAPGIIILVFAIAASKAIESLSDILYGLFQRREAMDRVGKSMVLRGLLSLCAAAVAVRLASSVLAASIAVFAAWVTVFLKFDVANGASLLGSIRALVPRVRRTTMVRMVRGGSSLGVVGMLISLTTNVPRYFIEHARGTHDLGIFVGLTYISIAATLAINALGAAALARLSTLYSEGNFAAFKHLVRRLVLYAAGVGVLEIFVAVLIGRPLLRVLYTAEYSAHAKEFTILMLAAGLGHVAAFLGYATTSARAFAAQIPLWIVIVATVASVSAWLIPTWGILGAVWALVAGAIMQLATYTWVYTRLFSRRPLPRETADKC